MHLDGIYSFGSSLFLPKAPPWGSWRVATEGVDAKHRGNSFHRLPRTPKARQAHFGEPQGAVPLPDHYRVVNRRLRHFLLNLVRTPSTAMRSP